MIADTIYMLCALASLVCAVLLFRAWRASGTKLLFWGAVCFIGLMLNNALLVIDMRYDAFDLAGIRILPALVGVGLLVYSLIRSES